MPASSSSRGIREGRAGAGHWPMPWKRQKPRKWPAAMMASRAIDRPMRQLRARTMRPSACGFETMWKRAAKRFQTMTAMKAMTMSFSTGWPEAESKPALSACRGGAG